MYFHIHTCLSCKIKASDLRNLNFAFRTKNTNFVLFLYSNYIDTFWRIEVVGFWHVYPYFYTHIFGTGFTYHLNNYILKHKYQTCKIKNSVFWKPSSFWIWLQDCRLTNQSCKTFAFEEAKALATQSTNIMYQICLEFSLLQIAYHFSSANLASSASRNKLFHSLIRKCIKECNLFHRIAGITCASEPPQMFSH